MTQIREKNDGSNYGVFAKLLSRLLDTAELFYQLLSEDLRLKQQCAEETRMNSEQGMYMDRDFDWEFQEDRR